MEAIARVMWSDDVGPHHGRLIQIVVRNQTVGNVSQDRVQAVVIEDDGHFLVIDLSELQEELA